jgi:hypothetical protein
MAGPTRLELATSGVTGRRSNQLNYDPASAFALARFGATRASGPALAYLCKRAICHTRKICLPSRNSLQRARPACRAETRFSATVWPAEPKRALKRCARRLVGGKGLEPLTAGV